MAKTVESGEKINKSQAIRDYVSKARRAKNSTVVAELAAQGITVSPQMVSTVRLKKRGKKAKRAGDEAEAATPSGDKVSFAALLRAKKIANQLGGVDKARQALDALAKIAKTAQPR